MNKRKPIVGELLYMLDVPRHCSPEVSGKVLAEFSVKVTKVGRKYFTVVTETQWPREISFHLDTWEQVTEYTPDYLLYESKEAYTASWRRSWMLNNVAAFFRNSHAVKLSNEQLEAMYNIVLEVEK